jgi:hypothetical protein
MTGWERQEAEREVEALVRLAVRVAIHLLAAARWASMRATQESGRERRGDDAAAASSD